ALLPGRRVRPRRRRLDEAGLGADVPRAAARAHPLPRQAPRRARSRPGASVHSGVAAAAVARLPRRATADVRRGRSLARLTGRGSARIPAMTLAAEIRRSVAGPAPPAARVGDGGWVT